MKVGNTLKGERRSPIVAAINNIVLELATVPAFCPMDSQGFITYSVPKISEVSRPLYNFKRLIYVKTKENL